MITLEDVRRAADVLAPVVRPTPLERADALSRLAGRRILLKHEERQRTGSFKIRGAYNRISALPAGCEIVAASAGNHAQGVALAGSLTGHATTIYMPLGAPLPKVAATSDYGARVVLEGDVVDDAMAAAIAHAEAAGAVFVPPFDDPLVIAGQGTVGLELSADPLIDDVGVVVVPVGGGGLIAGIATALAHTRRSVKVIGVEAAGAAAMKAAVDARKVVRLDRISTMADGIAVRSVSDLTLAHAMAYVDDVVTVTEEETSQALLLLLERAKSVVEPSGAVGLAAVLAGKIPGADPVACVVTGGNVDPLLLTKLIDHGLSSSGRYLLLRVEVTDRPGGLAELTAAVARMGLNVLSVEHHRAGMVALDAVEVLLTLETRNPAHRHQIVEDLRAAGFAVDLVR